jgi:hypothetical protein
MKTVPLLCLLALFWATPAQAAEVNVGCQRVRVVLDARLTPAVVNRRWASGEDRPEAPATLELLGCQGQQLDRMTLDSPLAKLDPRPVRGAPFPTVLVTVDLTAEFGSYSGPLTMPVQIVDAKLGWATARSAEGIVKPIAVAKTGKAAWKRVLVGKASEDLLSVSCQPGEAGFTVSYQRFHPTPLGWVSALRVEAGFWESDASFPASNSFPPVIQAPR